MASRMAEEAAAEQPPKKSPAPRAPLKTRGIEETRRSSRPHAEVDYTRGFEMVGIFGGSKQFLV